MSSDNQTASEYLKDLEAQQEATKQYNAMHGTCPNCGYCPHCGRSARPSWPYSQPWYPNWPVITWTSTSPFTNYR